MLLSALSSLILIFGLILLTVLFRANQGRETRLQRCPLPIRRQPAERRQSMDHCRRSRHWMLLGAVCVAANGFSAPDAGAVAVWASQPVAYEALPAASTALAATEAEDILAAPNHPDFLKVRNYLTQRLVDSDKFDRFPEPVLIDLSKHLRKDMIKYVIDQRPGILSVIYYSRQHGQNTMLVYWPELSGEQVIYTPLSGFASGDKVPLAASH